jgi:hypothetical protein
MDVVLCPLLVPWVSMGERFCGDFSRKEKRARGEILWGFFKQGEREPAGLHVSLGRKGMDEEIGDTVYTLVVIGHSVMRLPARWVSAPLPRPPAPLSPGRNPRIEQATDWNIRGVLIHEKNRRFCNLGIDSGGVIVVRNNSNFNNFRLITKFAASSRDE